MTPHLGDGVGRKVYQRADSPKSENRCNEIVRKIHLKTEVLVMAFFWKGAVGRPPLEGDRGGDIK